MRVPDDIRLYCFSPGPFLRGRDPLDLVNAQIRGGADVIQLREKDMEKRERLELGLKLRQITGREGVLFIVDDDVDLTVILDADGVHLGQKDIPIEYARPLLKDRIIGISTHNLAQAEAAVKAGADYIGLGPVFATGTKKDPEPLVGLELIADVERVCPVPVVAIGGIGLDNIGAVVSTGCRRTAVISDIMLARDTEARCRRLKKVLS